MDKSEEVFVSLFSSLREEFGVGLALKAEGRNITLRVRSEKKPGDEKQPHFALVVGDRDGALRISYKPRGVPSAESQVMIVMLRLPIGCSGWSVDTSRRNGDG